MDDASAAEGATTAVDELKADIGIPARMSSVGVHSEHVPEMAKIAFSVKRILRVNPRPVTQDDLLSILDSAR